MVCFDSGQGKGMMMGGQCKQASQANKLQAPQGWSQV